MIRTYKRKLILTKSQEQRIESWIGACRTVYNMGLEIQIASYRAHQKKLHKFELFNQLKYIKDIDWIADAPNESLEAAIDRLDRSYQTFFRTLSKGGGFPKFANKHKYKSMLFKNVSVKGNKVKVRKMEWLKISKDTEVNGSIRTATIKKEVAGYFIYLVSDAGKDIRNKDESQVVGFDMGVSYIYVDSNGEFLNNPKHFKSYERKLRVENRSLSRKKKGSSGWKRQAKRVSLLHNKIANVRKDFLHKQSTYIARKYSCVYMEDLNVKGMAKNKNLSKHILDCGWGMFRTMLEYKTSVFVINPKFTSQTCNECGVTDSKSRTSQSEFVCTSCGHISNADFNAAKNIKKVGEGIALNRKREAIA